VTHNRAEEYRRLAQDCEALARSSSTEDARIAFLDLARHWSYLAEQQEKGTDIEGPIPPVPAAESQPAAQQQQQVQPTDDDKKD
jgi:hypothetical protein